MSYHDIILGSLTHEAVEAEVLKLLKLGKAAYTEQASSYLKLGSISTSRSYFLETEHGLMPMKLIARTAYAKNSTGRHNFNSITYGNVLQRLGFTIKHEPQKAKEKTATKKRTRQLKYYEVLTRPNQAEFRRGVIKRFKGRCALTGCRVLEAMEAAHILPVADNGSDEARNGILLRRDVHRLFDLDLITISPKNGNVKVDSEIYAEYRAQVEASVDLKMLDIEMLKLRYSGNVK